jgi:8-oxo-dGTP diphosphatase
MAESGKKHVYDFPRAGLTVDVAVLALIEERLSVALIKRAREPYAGRWALPGGYVEIDETLVEAARRELREETNLAPAVFEPVGAFDAVDRDPRGRTITFAYLAVGVENPADLRAGDDAAEACWRPVRELPEMAFDHAGIVVAAVKQLDRCIDEARLFEYVLPEEFSPVDVHNLMNEAAGVQIGSYWAARLVRARPDFVRLGRFKRRSGPGSYQVYYRRPRS